MPSLIPVVLQLMEIKYNCQSQQTFRGSKTVYFKLLTGYILNGLSGWPTPGRFQTTPSKGKRETSILHHVKMISYEFGMFCFYKFFTFYPLIPAPLLVTSTNAEVSKFIEKPSSQRKKSSSEF